MFDLTKVRAAPRKFLAAAGIVIVPSFALVGILIRSEQEEFRLEEQKIEREIQARVAAELARRRQMGKRGRGVDVGGV